ncbi:MAG TPA: methylated-DNA--[protein]-cysteine S-methyltransferase [Petrimonas sp.]|uniref:methylated-DNA--[protein]-cysteine S-methyltransferase n=1 Tax=Petrimonas sp. TaxID=2023866 RepID=UPI0017737A09|nr:methylated-DNA--[protein]-cysteine S-methyltransferase [Petrimonas sp.]
MNNSVSIAPLSKKEMKDLVISYFFYETDYGLAIIASTPKGICYIGFGEKEPMTVSLKKNYPKADFREQKAGMHELALGFIKNEKVPELTLHISGTDFQLGVWRALLQIPAGKLSSYQAVANAVNNPKAVRAVGSAIGDNPVSYIIPCHRVIRSDGGLGGYFWGLDIKKKMIEKEAEKVKISV